MSRDPGEEGREDDAAAIVASRPRWGDLPDQVIRLAFIAVALGIAVGLGAYAATGLQARFWADDFCIAGMTRDVGLLGTAATYYGEWSGRFTGTFLSGIASLPGPAMASAWGGLLILAWLPVLAWTIEQLSARFVGRTIVPAAVLLAGAIVLGYLRALPNRIESVYWLAGSISYTLPLIMASLIVGIAARQARRTTPASRAAIAAAFVVALLGAGSSETYAAWQTGLLGIGVVASRLSDGPAGRMRSVVTGALIGSIVGALIVLVAPGNAVRAAALPAESASLPLPDILPRALSEATALLLAKATDPGVMLAAGVAVLVAILAFDGVHPRSRWLLLSAVAVGATAEALIAVAWLPSLVALHHEPPPRALAPAVLTVVLSAVALGVIAGLAFGPILDRLRGQRVVVLGLASVALVIGCALVVRPILRGEVRRATELGRLAAGWDARDQALSRAEASGVSVATTALLPGVATLEDVTPDPGHWVNVCVARYYGLGSVVAR